MNNFIYSFSIFRCLNRAMKSFDATVVVPTNFVLFTISAIISGKSCISYLFFFLKRVETAACKQRKSQVYGLQSAERKRMDMDI